MYEDALARVDLFSGLRKKELQEVATCCREGKYSPGSVLISQGEKGLGLFILTKGTVRITRKTSPDGAPPAQMRATSLRVTGEARRKENSASRDNHDHLHLTFIHVFVWLEYTDTGSPVKY